MSEKNKAFRNHCVVDTLLDKENSQISVSVAYKPQLLDTPANLQRYTYNYLDVVEEVQRQGIAVGTPVSGVSTVLDNTTIASRRPSVAGVYEFQLLNEPVADVAAPLRKKSDKRTPRPKPKVAKSE